MKATAEQLFNATVALIAARFANSRWQSNMSDSEIQSYIDIAKRTADMIPDNKPQRKHDTAKLFEGFPWKDGGVTRTEMEAWLKMHSGYTSNRSMQTIINNALAEGVTHKDIHLGKYLPGPDNSHA